MKKKLSLNKLTISHLNGKEMKGGLGGRLLVPGDIAISGQVFCPTNANNTLCIEVYSVKVTCACNEYTTETNITCGNWSCNVNNC